MTATWQIIEGDCRETLATLPAGSVQTCVTSPPYFGLRDYGHGGQIGLEPTPDEFVAALVGLFREVRRVLRDDGTAWLNLGDSYAATETAKPKDLLGIPWMVAFALRADGWYLRSDIIWAKPNPMPESVTDRPTKAHEYLFLLSKRPTYHYDADAIREPGVEPERQRADRIGGANGHTVRHSEGAIVGASASRNKRSVWTVATQPFPGAHFATFPPKLIEPCILAGCPERACGECGAPWERIVERTAAGEGIECPKDAATWAERPTAGAKDTSRLHGQYHDVQNVTKGFAPSCGHDAPHVPGVALDPFAGAGTTGMVALRLGRSFIGCELSADYVRLARDRIIADSPLLNSHAEAA